jgi:hypothetical protein
MDELDSIETIAVLELKLVDARCAPLTRARSHDEPGAAVDFSSQKKQNWTPAAEISLSKTKTLEIRF